MDIRNHCLHINTLIEDVHEGTLVCFQCCRVIEMNLEYHNFKEDNHSSNFCSDGATGFIDESCHRMNLPTSVIEGINHQFKKFREIHAMRKIHYKDLAAYSIYYHLKQENIGKPIEIIACNTGIESKKIWRCEMKDQQKPLPLKIESLIRGIHKYLFLKEEDCQNILQLSNHFRDSNFSPVTLAATLTWSYCKIKKMNISLATVRSLYKCCHMSMYRCRKYISLDKVNHILDM